MDKQCGANCENNNSHNTSGHLLNLSSANGTANRLDMDSFNQKSQSIRLQMQVLNDKLFETEKLKSLNLKKKFMDRNHPMLRSSKDQEDYALTEQQNRMITRSEEGKTQLIGKQSPKDDFSPHISSPYKENYKNRGEATIMRDDRRAIQRSQSSSMDNCGTEKASAYRSIAQMGETNRRESDRNKGTFLTTDQTTQELQTIGVPDKDNQNMMFIQHKGPINDQLNLTYTESKIVQMCIEKYVQNENLDQSPQRYGNQKAREVLSNIMQGNIPPAQSDRNDPKIPIQERYRLLGNYVIPETSLEVSISKQSKNTGSNQLENTRQGRRATQEEIDAIRSGENSKYVMTIADQVDSSKKSSAIKVLHSHEKETATKVSSQRADRAERNFLELHQISQHKGSEDKLETSNFHQHDKYREHRQSMLLDHRVSDEQHPYLKDSSNSGKNQAIFNSNKILRPIDNVSLSPRKNSSNRSQIDFNRQRSSYSNLTNNGKSEPICSEVETQRQTVISNFQQFNQERLQELAGVDPQKQMSSNSINRIVMQNAPIFKKEEQKVYHNYYDPFDQGLNEVNETCFFKEKPFENTRSHDALFQSTNKLLNEVQEEINFRKNQQPGEVFEDMIQNGTVDYKKIDSGQIKILRKSKKKKTSITANQSPKEGQKTYQKFLNMPTNIYNSQGLHQNKSLNLNRSISQVQNRSILGMLVGKRFSSNKRQSYKSVNQLYNSAFSNKSRSMRKNHDIIKDKIKLQNYNRDLSQKSALSESNIRYSQNSKFADEPIHLHNHLSSVQNLDNLPYSHSTSQNHLKKLPYNKNYSSQESIAKPPSEPKQSTNSWSQLNPSGLPEQIHQQADGFIRLSNDNFNQYLKRTEKAVNNYNTQNIHNLNILKTLQSSLLQTQGGNNNQNPDPTKNLRNFFIQSSLTFNGNNLNSRQSKTKSMSIEGGASDEPLDRTYGHQTLQIENVVPQYLDEINEYEDQIDEDESYDNKILPTKSHSGPDSCYNNYRSQSQFQQTQSQSHSNQDLSRQNSQAQYQSQCQRPNFSLNAHTIQNPVQKAQYMKQFQTQQDDSTVYQNINQDQQTTSGFLSGGAMAGFQSAFGGGMDEFGSIQQRQEATSNCSHLPQQNEDILLSAFEPMSVFDLPSALQEVQRAQNHIEELRQELIEKSRAHDDLIQNYQNLQSEAQTIGEQAINAQNQLDMNFDAIRALQEQNEYLQNVISKKDEKLIELEENNHFLQNRELSIQHTIEKLKSKYKQKLLEKEGEIGQMRVQTLQMQQQCHDYAQEIERLQYVPPQHQIIGSFGQGNNFRQNTELTEEKSPQIGVYVDSQRDASVQAMDQSPQQPPINMHMEMNLNPMTREIEKLRTYITTLIDSMAQNGQQNQQVSNTGSSNEVIQMNEPQYILTAEVIKEIKDVLSSENSELREKMKSYKEKMYKLQRQNDGLKLENAKIIQNMHNLKKDVLELKMQGQDARTESSKEQIVQMSQVQKRAQELEEKLMKEKVQNYQIQLEQKQQLLDLTKKYDRQLRDMRAALGFCFGMAELNQHEVPGFLSEKLTKEIPPNISNEDLENSLVIFQNIYRKQTENKNINHKILELKKENKKLHHIINQEQKARRMLLSQLQEYRGNIRVLCRVIPTKNRTSKRSIECTGPQTIETSSYTQASGESNIRKKFNFDKVFDQDCNQEDIFYEVQDLIQSSMEGYNVCIMSYGQTGSGKTYTMVGDDRNPGLYFAAVDEIYQIIKEKQQRIEYEIQVSVIEIYNEQIKDLLQKDQNTNKVKLLEGSHGDMYGAQVKRKVQNKNQILKALRDACYNRTVGVTQFNEQSSRSHFIMTIYITGYDKSTREVFHGKLGLVDLAGSERILKTNAEGMRVKEAQHINQSLATLGKVFLNLQNKSKHIPYRDSKLTHYLKDSIGGNAKTMMILQVRQSMKDHNESLGTLTFGQRAQMIRKGSITRARSASGPTLKRNLGARSASACSGLMRKKVDHSMTSFGRCLSNSLIASKTKRKPSKKGGERQLSRSMVKLSNNNTNYRQIQSCLQSRSQLDRINTDESTDLYRSESEKSCLRRVYALEPSNDSLAQTVTQRSLQPDNQRQKNNIMNITGQSVYATQNISENEPHDQPRTTGQNSSTKFESHQKKAKLLQELDQVHKLINDIDQKIEKQAKKQK